MNAPDFNPFAPRERVSDGPEMDRIAAIPRRHWSPERARQAADQLTAALAVPGGPCPGGHETPEGLCSVCRVPLRLRPIQAIALYEAASTGGLLGAIRVGGGKTLISLLLPRVLPAARPLLILPAALTEKTRREMSELRRHWAIPPWIAIESYETLSRVKAADLLTQTIPDLIVCDEAHKLKNGSAACTKRVFRYIRDRRKAGHQVWFAAMSGTFLKRSVKDVAHIASFALTYSKTCPFPEDFAALEEWSRAIDVSTGLGRRILPGALERLADPGEPIRHAVHRRIVQSPGVVASTEEPLPIKLTLRSIQVPEIPEMAEHWPRLRDEWTTPDGWECVDAPEIWRHARELGLGCCYRWDPRPPMEWRTARSDWAKACRYVLKNNRSGLDTELQVKQAIDLDTPGRSVADWEIPGVLHPETQREREAGEILAAWRAVEPTFKPNVVHDWHSPQVLDAICAWARESPGIVWISHRAVAIALAARGLPCYLNDGVDSRTGRVIESHDPREGSIVASIASNATGRNLQAWSRALVVGVPPNGSQWEQLLGRMHRDGQQAEEVTFDVLFACGEDVRGFWRSVQDAEFQQSLTGQPHKLVSADLEDVAVAADFEQAGPQWAGAEHEKDR